MAQNQESKIRDRALFDRLYVAQEDLRQAMSFASMILKKGWHFQPWEKRQTIYIQQSAYTTALVVAYSRPFTESRGWPKLPMRLMKYNEEQKQLHKRVLSLRNEVYAHTDVAKRNLRTFEIDGTPSAIEALPAMRFTREETEMIIAMMHMAYESIGKRLVELMKSVVEET
ncbi:MAG: hypothetical protein P8163_16280 [Candidatus Thiodiazotropha sp.]